MTRPQAQSESFAVEIARRWSAPLKIIHSPLIEIVPLPVDCDAPDAVIFTSANGVAAAGNLNLPRGLPAWCVGPKTAELAEASGFKPTFGPGDADGLVADIIAAKPDGRLAHIRGIHARGEISTRLSAAGLTCLDVIAYDQQERILSPDAQRVLAAKGSVFFPLFSPRTATILWSQGPFAADVRVIALSDAVKATVPAQYTAVAKVALRPDGEAMFTAVLEALGEQIGRS